MQSSSLVDALLTWIPSVGTLIAGVLLGYLARPLLLRRIEVLSSRTETNLDDLLVSATRRHIPFWFFLGGLLLAAHLAPPTEIALVRTTERLVEAGFVLSLALVAGNCAIGLLERSVAGSGAAAVPQTSLMRAVVRSGIFVLAGLWILQSVLGKDISSLLTALGVGSLAVALALQPTLTNLFAGVYMSVSRPVRVGDFIELEDGRKGTVSDIGWRVTRIVEPPNNLIVIPNAKLAEMVVRNYSLPQPELAVPVEIGVDYASDLEQVERVTLEVARGVLREVEGGVGTSEPVVRFHTFGPSSIDFTLGLRARSFAEAALVKHELVKRLKRRFDAEGIVIPFPQQVVHDAREDGPAAG